MIPVRFCWGGEPWNTYALAVPRVGETVMLRREGKPVLGVVADVLWTYGPHGHSTATVTLTTD